MAHISRDIGLVSFVKEIIRRCTIKSFSKTFPEIYKKISARKLPAWENPKTISFVEI